MAETAATEALLLNKHGSQPFFCQHFDENGVGYRTVDDEYPFDTAVNGIGAALDFGNHTAGNDSFVRKLLHVLHSQAMEQGGRIIGVPEHTVNISQEIMHSA